MINQRYKTLEIWKLSIEFTEKICVIAERLEKQQMYRFSDYMKSVCIRISNTIAEISDQIAEESINCLLTTTHLSLLETENIIMILDEQQLIELSEKIYLLDKIHFLNEKIIEYKQQCAGKNNLNEN